MHGQNHIKFELPEFNLLLVAPDNFAKPIKSPHLNLTLGRTNFSRRRGLVHGCMSCDTVLPCRSLSTFRHIRLPCWGSSLGRWRRCALNLDSAARQQHGAVNHGQGSWLDLVLSGNTASEWKGIAVRMYTDGRRKKEGWFWNIIVETQFGLPWNVVRLRVGVWW